MMGFFKHLGSLFRTGVSRLGLLCFGALLTALTFFSSGQAAGAHPAPAPPEEVPPSPEMIADTGGTILDLESGHRPVITTGTAEDLLVRHTDTTIPSDSTIYEDPYKVSYGIRKNGDLYTSVASPTVIAAADGNVIPNPQKINISGASAAGAYTTEDRCTPIGPPGAVVFIGFRTNQEFCTKITPDHSVPPVISTETITTVGGSGLAAAFFQKQQALLYPEQYAIIPPESQQWQGNIADAAAAVQQRTAAAANDAASPAEVMGRSPDLTATPEVLPSVDAITTAQPIEQQGEDVSSTATPETPPQDQAAAEEQPTTPTLTLEPVPVVTLDPLDAAAFLPSDDLEAEAEAAEVVVLEVEDAQEDPLEFVFANPAQTAPVVEPVAEPAALAESTTVAVSDYALCTTDAQRADLLMSMYEGCAQR